VRWRSNVIQGPLVFVVTGFFGTLALVVSVFAKTGRTQHRIARIWARACVWISFSRLVVRGAENLRKAKVAVYASNHTSYMDTPVIFGTLPFQFRILAKRELWTMPFIGWYLARSGQIPVESAGHGDTLKSLGAGVKALRSGMPLVVFPEGSRTADGELRPFLSGAAFLAIRAQVPLVPIALKGVFDLLPMHTRHFYPGEMSLTVGEPIETKGMTVRQIDELNQRLRNTIVGMLEE
jgi:1-acyl-sn-glycerol-3-phosphate acyltransferase